MITGNLYLANVGDCRGLLCKIDTDGALRVIQLSVDHNLSNEDELLRLSRTGLNIEKLRQGLTLLKFSNCFSELIGIL